MASPGNPLSGQSNEVSNPVTFDDRAASTCHQVSWQHAFLLLVPVALNSMIQPSGKVLGFSQRYAFALRSAPLLGAFDALVVAVSAIYWRLELGTTRAAARKVARLRFQDSDVLQEVGFFQRLLRNRIFRLCLFFLGALLQLIRLYRLHDVFWTKVWATMYLTSFATIELVGLLLGQDLTLTAETTTKESTPGWLSSIGSWAVCTNTVVCLYCVGSAVMGAMVTVMGLPLAFSVTVDVLLMVLLNAILLTVIQQCQCLSHVGPVVGACTLLPIMLSFKIISVVEDNFYGRVSALTLGLICVVIMLCTAIILVNFWFVSWCIAAPDRQRLPGRKPKKCVDTPHGLSLVWLHVLSALCVYAIG